VSERVDDRVEAPLLKAYLANVPSYPEFVPGWVTSVSWGVFIVLTLLLAIAAELAFVGTAIAGGVAYGLHLVLQNIFRPRNTKEESDAVSHSAVRKLKRAAGESNLNKRLPKRVLAALEDAVEAHNIAAARLTAADPEIIADSMKLMTKTLHGCFLAAIPVLRSDNMSRRDWNAMQTKSALIEGIVDSIESQSRKMRDASAFDRERLAALAELDAETASPHLFDR
jgi:hypothetical protein